MKRVILVIPVFLFMMLMNDLYAQDKPARPKYVKTGVFVGISKPLRDIPPMSAEDYKLMELKAQKRGKNTPWPIPSYPFASTALPKGPDPVWQQTGGNKSGKSLAPILNFDGQSSPYYPPDCNGATGPNHFMQTVNTTYAIYNKSGTLLAGPTAMNLLFGSVPGATYNDGDPIILFDEQANRWVAVEFSVTGSNDYMLFAVSTTSDPTGTWYQYSFDVVDMPDYEKVSVWRDGYYMGTNTQPTTGNDIYVFERAQMLVGGTAQMVAFDNPYRPGTGVVTVPPVDNDGTFAPTGSPGLFIAFNDDGISGGADQLWLYELAVNWTTPSSSTFNRTQQINVAAFNSNFGSTWENITQPGTTRKLCAISTVIMNAPQYRNFGTYQSIVCCHTVDVDGTYHAGIRWYELRKTPPATTWTLRQQGTYAPDAHSRWMGAISMNGANRIALGYSISSGTLYPGIRYVGQSASGYASASGLLDIPEENVLTGANYQTTYNRWGDYSSMCIDPSNDQTFWYTTEYIGASEARKTRIISFNLGNNPLVTTTAATLVNSTSATLNGTVNPNGLATTYHFEWGTTTSYGNTTTETSAGSGITNVAVNAAISGLTTGVTYHFRVVATNSDGSTSGNDVTFIPGAAVLITTAATSITTTSATTGGNITADGGVAVTERGVCWSTTANPTISGNHTSDGTGKGVFTSYLTTLSPNTTYHIRAYATNGTGTFYGDDLTFSTLCSVFTLPFTESFTTTSLPNCWTLVDNQGNGQVWVIGTLSGQTPTPALTANYPYLNSDGYGSGNSQNSDLITPTLNLSGYSSVTLAFNHYFKSYSGSSGTVSYSINNGSTWTQITQFTTTSSANPTAFSQSIAAVAGQSQVKFKWNYTGTYGYFWAFDDVSITGVNTNTLSVTPSNQNVTAASGNTSFNVTSNTSWTVSSNQAWCTVPSSGTGNGTLTATYTQNTSVIARTANITVTVTGLTPIVVTVTQAGATPTLSVTPSNQSVTAPPGNTAFNVTSNTSWTVVSNQTWCTVAPSGSGNGTITATYTQNVSAPVRSATITVTVTGLTPITVTVTQAGNPTLAVLPANQDVPSAAGSTSFAVTSNTTWTAASDKTWCTVTPSGSGDGSITANYSQNINCTSRVANITVTVTGLTPVVVTVTQAAALPPTLTSSLTPPAICSNTVFSYNPTCGTPGTTFAWTRAVVAGISNPAGSGTNNPNETLINTTNLPVNVTYVYTLSVNGCINTQNVVVVINAKPTVVTSGNVTFCAGLTPSGPPPLPGEHGAGGDSGFPTITFTLTGVAPWNLSYTDGTNTYTLNGITTNPLLVGVIPTVTTTYTATALSDAICTATASGITGSALVTVNPIPVVDPVSDQLTYGGAMTAPVVFTGTGTGYEWTNSNPSIGLDASGTGNIPSFTAINTGSIPVVATITVTPKYTFNGVTCTGLPTSFTFTVNPAPTLSVLPVNQDVTHLSGSTTFDVYSNTSWTAVSNQSWCSATPSGTGNGTITANYTLNLASSPRVAEITVTVTGLLPVVVTVTQEGVPFKTLNIAAFIEGFYDEFAGQMRQTQETTDGENTYNKFTGSTVDTMSVILANANDPWEYLFQAHGVSMDPDGTMSTLVPSAFSDDYYIVLRQRNSVETWSAVPVSFAGNTINYNFTLAASQAFGNNLKKVGEGPTSYALYSGDLVSSGTEQDGYIDIYDNNEVFNKSQEGLFGYAVADVTGDAFVDIFDLVVVFNNLQGSVGMITPPNPGKKKK